MICPNCGLTQPDNAKFCSKCGSILKNESNVNSPKCSLDNTEKISQSSENPKSRETISQQSKAKSFQKATNKETTANETFKRKIISYWRNQDLFCKIVTISLIALTLLLFIACCKINFFSITVTFLQAGGLIASLLLHKRKIKCDIIWLKYLILAVSIVITVLNVSSYLWKNITYPSIFETSQSATPYNAQGCIGRDKDRVENDFAIAGFRNIEQQPVEDLEAAEKEQFGKVISVSINGIVDFDGNNEFKSSSKIIIQYHAFKKISAPLSSDEIKNMDAKSVLKAFEDAGFFNFFSYESFDLDPDLSSVEFENTVSINGTNGFRKGEKFSPDAQIDLISHKPYDKYSLKIIIDFPSNLFFSKYDIKFEIDGYTEYLKHGENAEFEYRLRQGKYTLSFISTESNSIKSSIDIELNGNTEACYQIKCYSDNINIKKQYIENRSAIGEQEAMVPLSASDCKNKSYSEIEQAFLNAGFNNIQTKILYDIYFGFTDEGAVDSVTLDGKTNFNRGDIFSKAASIVITYHMREESEPTKKAEETTTASDEGREIYDNSIGKMAIDVKNELEAVGYTVEFKHNVTKMDYTSSVVSPDSEQYLPFIIVGLGEYNSDAKKALFYIDTQENIDRLAEKENIKNNLDDKLDSISAWVAVENYGKQQYAYGFKLHYYTGRLGETVADENTWFLKAYCDVKNEYGAWAKQLVCEAYVTGTSDNPRIVSFYVY